MRLYSCVLKLGASRNNEVPKINVTAAEIFVLRHLHGLIGKNVGEVDTSVVSNVKHIGEVARTDAQERARLSEIYGVALEKRENIRNIDGLFGVGTKLPDVLEEATKAVVTPDEPIKVAKTVDDDLADLAG